MSASLEAQNLQCIRDFRMLFSCLNLQLQNGEAVQVQGPNGAGKTTLLRILCGLRSPDEGKILWKGRDIAEDRAEFQATLAYVGHAHGIKGDLTPLENLRFWSTIHPVKQDLIISEVLQAVGLGAYENILSRRLSAGQRRRVAIARLLITDARLWILDEPFTAIDTEGIRMIEKVISQHVEQGGMAVLTSHQPVTLDCGMLRTLRLQ